MIGFVQAVLIVRRMRCMYMCRGRRTSAGRQGFKGLLPRLRDLFLHAPARNLLPGRTFWTGYKAASRRRLPWVNGRVVQVCFHLSTLAGAFGESRGASAPQTSQTLAAAAASSPCHGLIRLTKCGANLSVLKLQRLTGGMHPWSPQGQCEDLSLVCVCIVMHIERCQFQPLFCIYCWNARDTQTQIEMQYRCKDARKHTSAHRHRRVGQRKSERGATPGIARRRRLARFRLFSRLLHSCAAWPFNDSIPMVLYVTLMRSGSLYLLLLFRRRSFAGLRAGRLQLPDARAACSLACLDATCCFIGAMPFHILPTLAQARC